MAKSSDVFKAKSIRRTGADGASWKVGLEPVEIEITPDTQEALEKFARERNISVSEATSFALAEWVRTRLETEKSVGKMVKKALDEEFNRIAEDLLFFYLRSKGKKGFSN